MSFSVRARGDSVATFRYVCVHLMETLGRWVPTTPELEAKILFGKHLWELAQHADAFGRRTHELRLGLQASRDPSPEFQAGLERIRALEETSDRLAALYDLALPRLASEYRRYLDATDTLLDEPSVRVLERVGTDLERLDRDRQELQRVRPDLAGSSEPVDRLRDELDGVDMITFRPDPAATAEAS